MSNREVLLDVALRLFNTRGTRAITTNHLASEAGVSVGNLYYHFNNKEAVIRGLFQRLDHAWSTRLSVPDPRRVTWNHLRVLIHEHFAIVWEFRFFYREQIALRQKDPTLTRQWNVANRRGRADMGALLAGHFAALGCRQPARADVQRLTDACWLIADYWLVHREMRSGPVHFKDLEEGVELFASVMQPLIASVQAELAHTGSAA